MLDQDKPKEQLIAELTELRQLVSSFTQAESSHRLLAEEFCKISKALKTLLACNKALLSLKDEKELLDAVCLNSLEAGGYRMAWIGFAEHDERKSVRPVAHAGYEDDYLKSVNITWADTERGWGPTGTAIRSGKPCIISNVLTDPQFTPWRAEAVKRGFTSVIGLPLITDGHTLGALTIYASEQDAFNDYEANFLLELAHSLAYGILTLRNQAEHEKSHAALHESEDRFRAIANTTTDAILITDGRGKIVFWNPAAENIFGYTEKEILGTSSAILKPERFRQVDSESMILYLNTGSNPAVNKTVEAIALRKDGHEFYVEVTTSCWEINGQPFFSGIMRDISNRKAATAELENYQKHLEELVQIRTAELAETNVTLQHEIDQHLLTENALNETASNFRSLVELSPDGICILQKGIVVFINSAGLKLIGAETSSQIIGKSYLDIVHPDNKTVMMERMHNVKTTSKSQPFIEQQFLRLDGSILDVEVGSTICHYNNERCGQVVFRDITQRKAVAAALGASEKLYRSVVETASDTIITLDHQGIITSWNKAASRIYGYSAAEIVGQPVSKIIPRRSINTHQMKATAAVSSASLFQPIRLTDVTGLKKDGTEFPAELSLSFWKSPDGTCVTVIIRDITERKTAERNLLESEERFRNLAESSTDAMVLVNDTEEIIFWNNSATLIFGYSKDEAIGMPLQNIVGNLAAYQQAIAIIQNRDQSSLSYKYFEAHGIRKDRQLFPVELSVSFWESHDGRIYSAIIRDITQRKLTETSLQRSEQQFRSVVETSSDAIITANSQNEIISWNKGAEIIFGYPADEILNKSVFSLVPERLHATHAMRIDELAADMSNTPKLSKYPSWLMRKDGTEFLAEPSAAKWETSEGRFITITLRDVTKRVQTEDALRRSEEQFRSLVETASDAIITTDLQGTIINWNKGAEQIYGYSADEIINKPFAHLVPGHVTLANQKKMLEYYALQNIGIIFHDTPLPGKRKDGSEFHAEGCVSKWEAGGKIFLTAIIRDITDRMRAEETLRQSEEKYRLTADIIPIHLGASDLSGKFILWNKYSEKMFGYTQEEALDKLRPRDIHETAAEAQEVADIAIKNGISDTELRMRHKDGSLFPAHLIVVPNKNSSGGITGLYGFAEDISTRRKAEDIIRKVNHSLLTLTPDPDNNIHYLVESAGKILSADTSVYHSIYGSYLNIKAEWNVPVAHKNKYPLKGSLFFHLLSQYGDKPLIINNAEEIANFPNETLLFHLPYKAFIAISVRTGNLMTGSLHIAYNQPQTFTETELNAFSILSKAIGIEEGRKKVLLELKRNQKKLTRSEKSLKNFSAKVLAIREEEKKNIAGALHDEIGSMAVSLSAHLKLAKDEIIENNSDQAIKNIVQTEATLRQSVEKLKGIALDLRPPDLNIVGLSTALENYVLTLSKKLKVAIDFTSTVKDRSISEETAIVLYRVCQEALNNALSHAKAHSVAVQLTSGNRHINLTIRDDGCGFDTKKLPEFSRKSNKLGIIGMRERIEYLGGTFTIESQMNKGTALFVSVPHK